jgi:ribosome-binding factor A
MPRDFPRSRRIEDQIQRILSEVVRKEARDPRLASSIITAVRVSKDLSVAWVYYSSLRTGSDDAGAAENLDDAFASAAGFLRGRLAKDLTVRRVPELRFKFDDTISHAHHMDELIDSVIGHSDPEQAEDSETDNPNPEGGSDDYTSDD